MRTYSKDGQVFLESISTELYNKIVARMKTQYGFVNGPDDNAKLRLSNYFVGVTHEFADRFISSIMELFSLPKTLPPIPNGFKESMNAEMREPNFH